MQTRFFPKYRWCALLFWATLSVSCLFDHQAKRDSEMENEVRVGTLFLEQGGPAVHARVRVYEVSHIPDSAGTPRDSSANDFIYSTTTDANGRYQVVALPKGEYNLLADLDGNVSYRDSVLISDRTGILANDTLDRPGSLRGVIRLQPDHDPRSATVQVLGTDHYANVDAEGRFRLRGLARGVYSLRILVNRPEYTALFTSARVRTGSDDTLPDTLSPAYTGIPVVTGMNASYDTLRGVVRLTWRPVEYRDLSDYLVYRDPSLSLDPSATPIGKASDTVFLDTLYLPSRTGLFDPEDGLDRVMSYRVRVRNKSVQVGLAYGSRDVDIAAPAKVRTSMEFRTGKSRWDSSKLGDSVTVMVKLGNPGRGLTRIAWFIGDSLNPGPVRDLAADKTVSDSIRFLWTREGPYRVHARVRDEAGTEWKDSVALPGNTAPELGGTPIAKAPANVPYLFKPTVLEPDGDPLVFSIANRPAWAHFDSSTGQLTGIPANSDAGSTKGIVIRVLDGRRSDSLPGFDLLVESNAWIIRKNLAKNFESGFSGSLDGKIYLFRDWYNPDQSVDRYDPATDSVSRAISLQENWILHGAHRIGGKFYVITTPNVNPPSGFHMRLYDPVANSWEDKGPLALERSAFTSAAYGGRIYFFGAGNALVEEYDPAANSLTVKKPAPRAPAGNVRAVTVKDRIYLVGDITGASSGTLDSMQVYLPVADAWVRNQPMKTPRSLVAACALDDRLYTLGGFLEPDNRTPVGTVEEFDPATLQWTIRGPMPTPRTGATCSEAGGRLYVFGGMGGFDGSPSVPLAVEAYEAAQDR
ncbi:MAG: Kelch repeat-containing protein precursor [Fibrobacteres bacterium]|nr:Kelch repeat-containing protein precursor [Fibrobacterota bacterium]